MSRKIISKGEELLKGDCLVSKNGNWKVIFQVSPTWASNTWKSDATRLCMQEDCNLVMYNDDNKPRWHTNTHSPSSSTCSLTLTNEGRLEGRFGRNKMQNRNQSDRF
uniref:Bulb-type lectin domain-containing protein n=1 Tax=Takifugu rubripes TaxID=31033 RepID=A0A3B5K2E7_TAKRU